MSAPGQTVGVSVFTDHLIDALGVTRNQLSLGYLTGTLASSLLLSRAGRTYDRYGARRAATAALALTMVSFSFTPEISESIRRVVPGGAIIGFVTATVGFSLLRFPGQGVLTLASRNMVMEWFEKRQGMDCGASFTLAQAWRTCAFWIFALAVFLSSLLVTAYTFHIVSICAEAGRSRSQAVAVFFPSSIVAVALQFAGSWLSDRTRLMYLAVFQMAGAVVLSLGANCRHCRSWHGNRHVQHPLQSHVAAAFRTRFPEATRRPPSHAVLWERCSSSLPSAPTARRRRSDCRRTVSASRARKYCRFLRHFT